MSLEDKAIYKAELKKLKRQMQKVVDWSCNTSEIKRDDLILELHQLAAKAIDSLPNEDEVVIRWHVEDVLEKASDIGLRLSHKSARDILEEIEDGLYEAAVDKGTEIIENRLYKEKEMRRQRRQKAV